MGQALTPLMLISAQQPPPPPQATQAPQALPGPAAQPGQPTVVQVMPGGQIRAGGSPAANLEAARSARSELRNQLERLEEQRDDLSQQLVQLGASPNRSDADVKGLETRIANIDTRILDVEKQLQVADANVVAAAGVPGSNPPPPPRVRDPGPPEEFWILSGIFLFVIGLPLTIAYARRIWKKSVGTITALPQEIYDRFNRLDQAIDSVAIEVERVGEGQRYLTRVYADQQRAVGAGPAERVESIERERERQARK